MTHQNPRAEGCCLAKLCFFAKGMKEKISHLESPLDQSDGCYKVRLKELEMKMQEVDDKATASLVSWNKDSGFGCGFIFWRQIRILGPQFGLTNMDP